MPGREETYPYTVLDVFTDCPLEGNQLAVFTDPLGLSTAAMRKLARELNLSETVFLLPAERDGDARLRIFTPASELPFAGHPVLGAAFLVGGLQGREVVHLETGVGTVAVQLQRESETIVFGRMTQPIPQWEPYPHEIDLLSSLGVSRSELPIEAYRNGPVHVYVLLDNEASVAALEPDLAALAAFGEVGVNCVAGSGRSWKTRMFAPGLGVNEDPATGSAAGPLAVHLARHGRIAFGDEIEIRQGVEIGRPSILYARADGTPERIERVQVGGSAVVVAHGSYRVR